MMDNIDLESKMEEAIRIGGLAELVKLNMRHCVTQCSVACRIRAQHETRLDSIERKIADDINKLDHISTIGHLVKRFPRWTYPVIFVSAVCAGLSVPVVVVVYLVLVSKGIMPKLW